MTTFGFSSFSAAFFAHVGSSESSPTSGSESVSEDDSSERSAIRPSRIKKRIYALPSLKIGIILPNDSVSFRDCNVFFLIPGSRTVQPREVALLYTRPNADIRVDFGCRFGEEFEPVLFSEWLICI